MTVQELKDKLEKLEPRADVSLLRTVTNAYTGNPEPQYIKNFRIEWTDGRYVIPIGGA